MADVTVDKINVEVSATADKATSALKELEATLSKIQAAMNSIDFSKLQQAQKSVGSGKKPAVSVDTSNMSKAEKEVSKSVAKIEQMLAGLQAYKNAALGGDKSATSSFEKSATKVQSALDVLQERFRQLGIKSSMTVSASRSLRSKARTSSQQPFFPSPARSAPKISPLWPSSTCPASTAASMTSSKSISWPSRKQLTKLVAFLF
jgi:DNA-binding ferritin-like protein